MRPFITQPQKLQAPISDLSTCRALIIDSNIVSGSVLRGMLGDLGLSGVVLARKVSEARRALDIRQFDVVLLDFHFDDCGLNGADLLDDLRRSQLLPYSTVVIMVTGEASYEKVAEAAESALDSYLIKPHTSNALAQRLHLARHRKVVLGNIFEAIEGKDFEQATHLCLQRVKERGEYWNLAARMGGELLMKLSRFEEAIQLFQILEKDKPLPWIRLGIARAQLEAGQIGPAKQTLENLLNQNPAYADAYDVLARSHLQGGQFEEALEAYQRAVQVTPASINRLQKVGILATHLDRYDEASRALERAASLGVTSKLFDAQGLVNLALIRFDQTDLRGIQKCELLLVSMLHKDPESVRLLRMQSLLHCIYLLLNDTREELHDRVEALLQASTEPDFDTEAASNMMALMSRMRARGHAYPDTERWVTQMATRFCTSKAHTDMFTLVVQPHHPPFVELIQEAYKNVLGMAEKAMAHVRQNDMNSALRTLLLYGRQTSNAKLLDLADMLIKRYPEAIQDLETKAQELEELREQFCRFASHLQLGAGTGRDSGELKLRTS